MKSILVVEDDIDIRETLTGLLAAEGYSVHGCTNGVEALERLRAVHETDLILLDLMLPIMDGWQFRVLQRRDPSIASIPVLAMSADSTPKAAAIDAAAYLKKPVDYERLLATIERTLLDAQHCKLEERMAQTERLASLGTLAAGVAHEINNPLAYVAGNLDFVSDAMSNGAPSADVMSAVKQALGHAEEGCRRIRAIVSDLALFSSTRSDERRPIDVRRAMDSAVNMIVHEIRPRANLVRRYDEDVPLVLASEARLGQVFLNLVMNALQAIGHGDPSKDEIQVGVHADDSWVTVEVRDTGGGIPPEIRGKIFDPFFTTKAVGVGTGLGLSIASSIVRGHGGEIQVDSELGKGSVFRVRLPVARGVCEAKPAPRAPKARSGRRARLLVIDDEELIGALLVRLLSAHDIVTTTRPDDAIARIRAGERFDLVLCDMTMPGKSGIDVHEAIAGIDPAQAARMMFLTGGATTPRAQQFLAKRASAVVEKPFVGSEITARIDEAIAAADARERDAVGQ